MSHFFLSARERRALRMIMPMLEVDKKRFALACFLGVCGLGASVGLGAVAAWLIARASQMPPVLYLEVAAVSVRFFGISKALFRYLEQLSSHSVALSGMASLRTNLYTRLAATSTQRTAAIRRGDLLARTGADVDAIGDFLVKSLLPVIVTVIVGVITALGLAFLDPASGIILLCCLAISGFVGPIVTMRATRRAQEATQHEHTEVSVSTLRILENSAELEIAGTLPQATRSLYAHERALVHAHNHDAKASAWASALDVASIMAAVVAAAWFGIHGVGNGSVSEVALAVLVLTPMSLLEATAQLKPAAVQLVSSAGAAVRMADLLGNEEKNVPHATLHNQSDTKEPILHAENLGISWPNSPLLVRDISFDVHPGSRIAIVGPSGIGKTTLLLTLSGMLPPAQGTVDINGQPICQLSRTDASHFVTMTAEDAHIFETSVFENLRTATGSLSRDEATRLMERAGLGEWLSALPRGLDTVLGSSGTTISGGERRRLLLARALASPAPLMLLDEPGEHIDSVTADRLVRDLLLTPAHTGTHGVVLVTHRLHGLDAADKVLVLEKDDTGVAYPRAFAPHDELMRTLPGYQWAYQQEESNAS